nr:TPA_asm: hypothetical protein [Schmimed tricladivirus]
MDIDILCFYLGCVLVCSDSASNDRFISVDLNKRTYLQYLNSSVNRANAVKQIQMASEHFDFLGDLIWSKSKIMKEKAAIFRKGHSFCRDAGYVDMEEQYSIKTHIKLSKFRSLDVLPAVFRRCRELKAVKSVNPGGFHCFWTTGRVGACYQVSRCFCLCANVLPEHLLTDWLLFLLRSHILCELQRDDFLTLGKMITVLAKKGRGDFLDSWFALVDLNTWAGFNVGSSIVDETKKQVPDWIGGVLSVKHVKPELWDRVMDDTMDDMFSPVSSDVVSNANHKVVSFYNWILNPDNWVSSGASMVKGRVLTDDGDVVKSKGNKANVALKYTVEEIIDIINNRARRLELKPVLKIELGWKNRLIIKVDDFININASYSGRVCMALMKGNPHSSLFMNLNQQYNMWNQWRMLLSIKSVLAYPYDAPSFDQRITTAELRSYFKWKYRTLSKFVFDEGLKAELLNSVLLAEDQYFGQLCDVDGQDLKLDHGMVSGYFDTALGDSVISVSRNVSILRCVDAFLGHREMTKISPVGQGDDFNCMSSSVVRLCLHFQMVNKLGWGAHKEKNFIAIGVTEYLRKMLVVKENKVSGYLSRKMAGLLFRDPIKRGGAVGISKLREKVGALNVLITRGADRSIVSNYIYSVCHKVLMSPGKPFPPEHSLAIAFSPAACGGAGIWLDQDSCSSSSARWCKLRDLNDSAESLGAPMVSGVYRQNLDLVVNAVGKNFKIDNLKKQMIGQILVDGEVKPYLVVDYVQKVRAGVILKVGKMAEAPHKSDVIPKWLSELSFMRSICADAIKFCVFNDCLGKLEGIIEPISLKMLISLNGRWHRATFLDWLAGKLNLRSPLIVGFSPAEVSILNGFFALYFWVPLFSRHSVTTDQLVKQNLNVEYSLVDALYRGVLPLRYSD